MSESEARSKPSTAKRAPVKKPSTAKRAPVKKPSKAKETPAKKPRKVAKKVAPKEVPAGLQAPAGAESADEPSPANVLLTPSRYGLPAARYESAWTIGDIQTYLNIGRTRAYALVKNDGFPRRLRIGRAHRWNGLRVMAWLHGDDWRTVELEPSSAPDATSAARGADPTDTQSATIARSERHVSVPKRPAPPISPAPRRRVIDPRDVQHQRNKDKLAALLRRP